MKFSSLSLNYSLTIKIIMAYQNRSLIFIKYFLILLVLILFPAHLIPIIFAHPIYITAIIQV